MLLAVVVGALAAPVGVVAAFIRDQGQPYYLTEAEKRLAPPWSKWKELGIAIMGIVVGAATIAHGWAEAVVAGGAFAAAWAMGHLGGSGLAYSASRKGLSPALSYVALTMSGLLLAVGPAGVLIWHGRIAWVPLIVAAAAAKTIWYEIGYRVRPNGSPWPHATAIGAAIHGGTVLSATIFAMLAAAP